MPTLTLNFSLKKHSKVNIYLDDKLCGTVKENDQKRLDFSGGKHTLRFVQYRGKTERSPLAVGAMPYFGGGTSLNGDGTKSGHLIPWRATVHYCECTLDFTAEGDCTMAVLSVTEKERGCIGIDNHFITLKIGTVTGAETENITVTDLGDTEKSRFKRWQRIILCLTYLPLLAIIVWQTVVAFTHWSTPAIINIHGKFSLILPIILTAVMIGRIIYFSKKL